MALLGKNTKYFYLLALPNVIVAQVLPINHFKHSSMSPYAEYYKRIHFNNILFPALIRDTIKPHVCPLNNGSLP